MSTEILTVILTVLSVIVSVIIAYRQTSVQVQNLRAEIQQEVGNKIFEQRMAVYPELYSHLSKFIKAIEFGKISNKAVKDLLSAYQTWDTKNSILFSAETGKISYDLRKYLAELSKLKDAEVQKFFSTADSKKELRWRIQELELALKSELGIYAFANPSPDLKNKRFKSYADVTQSIQDKRK